MQNQTEVANDSFAQEMGKTFLLSAAATAGMMAGFYLVAKVTDRRNAKRLVKDAEKTIRSN